MTNPSKKEKERSRVILSANNAIKQILKMENIMLSHKKRLLSEMIWKITEADGLIAEKRTGYKKKIAFVSYEVKKLRGLGNESTKGLIHEHVYRRQVIIQRLLNKPNNINKIIKNAIGCVVTAEEHKRLHRVNKDADGWKRYKEAGIKVYNTRTNKEKKF